MSRKSRVSIHAPAWGATLLVAPHLSVWQFQSTRPRGARQQVYTLHLIIQNWFQSTRPRGARRALTISFACIRSFQSTRPRGARLIMLLYLLCLALVSIHAPAWGATKSKVKVCYCVAVSIHAPAWGATRIIIKTIANCACFNPRARVGRDKYATAICLISVRFQSTRPRGARRKWANKLRKGLLFQSTRPRGARQR